MRRSVILRYPLRDIWYLISIHLNGIFIDLFQIIQRIDSLIPFAVPSVASLIKYFVNIHVRSIEVGKFNIPRVYIKAEWIVFVCDWHCEQVWQKRVGAVHTAFYKPNSESRCQKGFACDTSLLRGRRKNSRSSSLKNLFAFCLFPFLPKYLWDTTFNLISYVAIALRSFRSLSSLGSTRRRWIEIVYIDQNLIKRLFAATGPR